MRFHTSLPVRDIDQTIEFYTTLFGDPPVKTKPDYAKFLPASGGLNISFHTDSETLALVRPVHLGFEIADQAALDAIHERLESAGLISVERETSICCYANQDKFWVTDPSGYEWELYVLLEDTEQKISEQTACCPTEPTTSDAATTSCC